MMVYKALFIGLFVARAAALLYLTFLAYVLIDYWTSGSLGGISNVFQVVAMCVANCAELHVNCHGFDPNCSGYMFTPAVLLSHFLVVSVIFYPWRKLVR